MTDQPECPPPPDLPGEAAPGTAQGNMRHAGPEIMLSKYAQVVTNEMHDVQVRCFESCGLGVGQNLLAENAGRDAIQ